MINRIAIIQTATKRTAANKRTAMKRATMKKVCTLALGVSLCNATWAIDLVQSYQRALSHDATWQADQLRFQIEQQNLGIAKAAALPTVGVNASIYKQYQDLDDSSNSTTGGTGAGTVTPSFNFYNDESTTRQVGLSIRQPLFRWDVWQTYKQVKISTQLAEVKLLSQQQDLMLNVAEKYFNVLRQTRLVEVNQQEVNSLAKQAEMIRAQYREGLVAKIDVSEAEAQHQSAIAKKVASDIQYQLALEELEQLVGDIETPLARLDAGFQYQNPIPNDLNAWLDMAERNNLNLTQSRLAHKVAEQKVNVEKADYFPQVEAVASTGWNKQSPETIISSNGRTDKIGIELNWTPYTGTRNALIKKSQIEANTALADVDTTRRQIQTEIKRSFLQVSSAYSQLNAYHSALKSAQQVADASSASYREGIKTMVDVLLAQRNAFSAQHDYVNAQYDYILSALQLKAQAGQLSEQDLIDFNQWLK